MFAFFREVINIIAEHKETIFSGLTTFLSVFFGAWLASIFGLHTYFKKREHEQIMKRYLEDGIDHIISEIDYVSGIFLQNYTDVLSIVESIKRNQEPKLPDRFVSFDPQYFRRAPFHKIRNLVGDEIFWKIFLLFISHVSANIRLLEVDFLLVVDEILKETDGSKKQEKIEAIEEVFITESFNKFQGYLLMLPELQNLASILEQEKKLTWKRLKKIKNRPDIKKSIEILKDKFGEKLNTLQKQ